MFYVHCELRRGQQQQVSWIPEKYAIQGKYLKLKNGAGEWEDGWMVTMACGRQDAMYIHDRSRDFQRTRQASDT